MNFKTISLLSLLLLSFLGTAGSAFSQNDGRIHLPPLVQQGQDTRNIPIKTQEQVDQERAKKAHALRQEEIRRDTTKLAQLSSELKEYIDKTNADILSLDAIKTADAIEKLAHGVKQKMKENR